MNTMFHRCPRYSVRSVHLRPLLLENFLDILAARRHLAVTYSKCRSRHRARIDPMTRCHSPSTPIHRRAPRPRRRPRPTAREPMSTRRVFRPPHALLVTRVSPNQSNAALLIGARAKNSQATSARHRSPGAARRRRQRQAHVPLPTSTSSPTRSTPGLSAQFLRTRHRRLRRGSFYAAGFSGIRRAPLASAATHAFVAAAAGQRDDGARCRSDRRFDGFDISCSVADAAAAPSFASARRREAADRAQTATTALLDLRSVSQWVRRVYQPELRRETDRLLSSPATAVCIIPHLCESRPHAARCACEVHGMKCGWRARV